MLQEEDKDFVIVWPRGEGFIYGLEFKPSLQLKSSVAVDTSLQ